MNQSQRQDIENFLKLCQTNKKITDNISSIIKQHGTNTNETLNQILTIAKKNGYNIKHSDILKYVRENNKLSPDLLQKVSGGASRPLATLAAAITFFSSFSHNQPTFAANSENLSGTRSNSNTFNPENILNELRILGFNSEDEDTLMEIVESFLSEDHLENLSYELRLWILSHTEILLTLMEINTQQNMTFINRIVGEDLTEEFVYNVLDPDNFLQIQQTNNEIAGLLINVFNRIECGETLTEWLISNPQVFPALVESNINIVTNFIHNSTQPENIDEFIDWLINNPELFPVIAQTNRSIAINFINNVSEQDGFIEWIADNPGLFPVIAQTNRSIAINFINNISEQDDFAEWIINNPEIIPTMAQTNRDVVVSFFNELEQQENFSEWLINNSELLPTIYQINRNLYDQFIVQFSQQNISEFIEYITLYPDNFNFLIQTHRDIVEENIDSFIETLAIRSLDTHSQADLSINEWSQRNSRIFSSLSDINPQAAIDFISQISDHDTVLADLMYTSSDMFIEIASFSPDTAQQFISELVQNDPETFINWVQNNPSVLQEITDIDPEVTDYFFNSILTLGEENILNLNQEAIQWINRNPIVFPILANVFPEVAQDFIFFQTNERNPRQFVTWIYQNPSLLPTLFELDSSTASEIIDIIADQYNITSWMFQNPEIIPTLISWNTEGIRSLIQEDITNGNIIRLVNFINNYPEAVYLLMQLDDDGETAHVIVEHFTEMNGGTTFVNWIRNNPEIITILQNLDPEFIQTFVRLSIQTNQENFGNWFDEQSEEIRTIISQLCE